MMIHFSLLVGRCYSQLLLSLLQLQSVLLHLLQFMFLEGTARLMALFLGGGAACRRRRLPIFLNFWPLLLLSAPGKEQK